MEVCECTERHRERASGEEKVFGRFWRGQIWRRAQDHLLSGMGISGSPRWALRYLAGTINSQVQLPSEFASLLAPSCKPVFIQDVFISFELAPRQGGERLSCMNNKTSILLSVR